MLNPRQAVYAAAWMTAVVGRTSVEASLLFGVSAESVCNAKRTEYGRVAFAAQMSDTVARARAVLEKDESTPAQQLSGVLRIPVSAATTIMRVIQFEDLRRKYADEAGVPFEPVTFPDRVPAVAGGVA